MVDGPVDPAAAQKRLVGRVDYCVDLEAGDVGLDGCDRGETIASRICGDQSVREGQELRTKLIRFLCMMDTKVV